MSANKRTEVAWNAIDATPAQFILPGGLYGITVSAGSWSSGTVTLQRLAADGSTLVTVLTAFSADGYASVNLPDGKYSLTIATATGVIADIVGIAEPLP